MGRKKKLDSINKNVLQKLMDNCKTRQEIADYFKVSRTTVNSWIKDLNIKYPTKRMYINHQYFDDINSEDKAYLLGFFIADGCIRYIKRKHVISYVLSFDNAVDDQDAIELLHSKICPEATLGIKNVNMKSQYSLSWTSEHMAKTLAKYNIYPGKTKDQTFFIPQNVIPKNLWRHFVRGFIDGDGHLDEHVLSFVFTSELFMNQIIETFKNFSYNIYKIKGKTSNYWKVVVSLNEQRKNILNTFLYKNSQYYLKRKYDSLNTEISYNLRNRVIEIVEHRAE